MISSKIIIKNKRKSTALETWKKILSNWINAHKKYMNECAKYKDNAYKYNERASLSILSAAVWLSNGISIEEYGSEKITNKKKYKGRVDLWFKINSFETIIESKLLKKVINRRNISSLSKEINKKLVEAKNDVGSTRHLGERNGYSVVFFTPIISYSNPISLNDIIDNVKECNCDLFAYINNKSIIYFNDKNEKKHNPVGFIIVKKFN